MSDIRIERIIPTPPHPEFWRCWREGDTSVIGEGESIPAAERDLIANEQWFDKKEKQA